MSSSVAFVCPIYDMKNHFELAFNLYKSKIENGIENDFYFIFSNIEQKDKFEKMIKSEFPNNDFKYLITTDEINRYKAKAVTKKFFALKSLMYKYEYIILTDCESLFIKKCDFDSLAEEIWSNKTMLNSNKSPNGYFIMRKCYRAMGIYYNKKLRKDTQNFKYYFSYRNIEYLLEKLVYAGKRRKKYFENKYKYFF